MFPVETSFTLPGKKEPVPLTRVVGVQFPGAIRFL
jgi:hypothetical protein